MAGGGGPNTVARTRDEAAETAGGGERKSDEGAKRPPLVGAAEQGHEADALDLRATVLPILLKSYWKPIAGLLVVLCVLRKLLGGRRS